MTSGSCKDSKGSKSFPSQDTISTTPVFPLEQAIQMREELRLLSEKGVIATVPDSQGGFYSNLFLVPKKNGQMKPVINLKWLNEWVTTEHFKKEGISTPKDILQ